MAIRQDHKDFIDCVVVLLILITIAIAGCSFCFYLHHIWSLLRGR